LAEAGKTEDTVKIMSCCSKVARCDLNWRRISEKWWNVTNCDGFNSRSGTFISVCNQPQCYMHFILSLMFQRWKNFGNRLRFYSYFVS